ncbi:DNA replication factor Cdt1 isoform X2 [Anopheles gambiae]|uniref:DNA replication factor Cdt1 isoform X2 n=1 Tax=Anopheles gambiae TaxID=7165 RepID=UPI002AC8F601|nr:DNA replication factor Cdt1 isoform X2 [Anopheles gambiae]
MSQPTVASYFNTRKRAAHDTLGAAGRNKNLEAAVGKDNGAVSDPAELGRRVTRASRAIRRIGPVDLDEKTKALLAAAQPKLVSFVKKGNLSPQKRPHTASPSKRPAVPEKKLASPVKVEPVAASVVDSKPVEFSPRNNLNNVAKAPTKASVSRTLQLGKDKDAMSLTDIRNKLLQHPRLPELKTKLNAIQSGLDKMDRLRRERLEGTKPSVSPAVAAKNLEKFATLDVEVMVSPKKTIASPSKLLRTPTKDASSSPANNVTPKRLSALMSPIKEPTAGTPVMASPKKLPAYQRFHNLVEAGVPTLQLPFKYRSLLELFKCTDTVCSMLHNRKEQITFKKLKPAVQRMARKNFFESHLAQIYSLFPDAFTLSQEMTKNYGSATKHETYQLVIRPNIADAPEEPGRKAAEDDFIRTNTKPAVNSQSLLERYQHFRRLLLERTKDAHQAFLQTLDPPLNIDRSKIVRWHVDFDLENCPDIEKAELPQPPNVERFSSARDVLSTARNLFSCGTPMERALARLEEKKKQDAAVATRGGTPQPTTTEPEDKKPPIGIKTEKVSTTPNTSTALLSDPAEQMLKNVPKALLEKIRAKQAAKALEQMVRRPSQEKEAMKYSRLPEIARHLRNVFVTERKNVLPLETPVVKIENSYRGKLTLQELEEHIRMIAQLVPFWLTLPEVRKVKYAKIAKDCDLAKVIDVLERKANEVVQ